VLFIRGERYRKATGGFKFHNKLYVHI
jgi:hypothetical protein